MQPLSRDLAAPHSFENPPLVEDSLPLGILPVPAYFDPELIPALNDLVTPDYKSPDRRARLPFFFPFPFDRLTEDQKLSILKLASIRQIPTFSPGDKWDRRA